MGDWNKLEEDGFSIESTFIIENYEGVEMDIVCEDE